MSTQLDLLAVLSARDEGIRAASDHTADWERQAIDEAIRTVMQRGCPFTANDTRALLPAGVKGNRVSARFGAWSKSGLIVKTGRYVTSTDVGTKGAMVREWIGAAWAVADSAENGAAA